MQKKRITSFKFDYDPNYIIMIIQWSNPETQFINRGDLDEIEFLPEFRVIQSLKSLKSDLN